MQLNIIYRWMSIGRATRPWLSGLINTENVAPRAHPAHRSFAALFSLSPGEVNYNPGGYQKVCIEWRLQVQIAFLVEVDLAPSRPE